MRPAAVITLVFVCGTLPGCSATLSRCVIGDTPAKLDPEKWNASWGQAGVGSVVTRVKDAEAGVLEFAALELTADEITVHRGELYVRRAGGWLWASGREQGVDEFWIARISDPGNELIAWRFDPRVVRRLVTDGTIAGRIIRNAEGKETGDVSIDGLSDADLARIRDGAWGELFDWGEPVLVLQRLPD